MSDSVAVTGSAEIDYATIDGSHIGAVIIAITEGAAAIDSISSKHKSATKTLTEGAVGIGVNSHLGYGIVDYIVGWYNSPNDPDFTEFPSEPASLFFVGDMWLNTTTGNVYQLEGIVVPFGVGYIQWQLMDSIPYTGGPYYFYSKFKNAYHTDIEHCGNLDIVTKFKSVAKIFFDRMGLHDVVENIYNLTHPHQQHDYPAIRVQNDSR